MRWLLLKTYDPAGNIRFNHSGAPGIIGAEEPHGKEGLPLAMEPNQSREIGVGEVIGIANQKSVFTPNKGSVGAQGTRAPKEDFLETSGNLKWALILVQELVHTVSEMVQVDEHVLDSMTFQEPEPPPQ